MGCGPSKPATAPAEAPSHQATKSSIHAARPVNLQSSRRDGNRDMNDYANYLQQQRHNNIDEPNKSFYQSRNEQDKICINEWPPHKPLLNRKSSPGSKMLEGNRYTGRRRVGQSISNPNPNPVTLSLPIARGDVELSFRSPSPVSSVGTAKWDRSDMVKLRR